MIRANPFVCLRVGESGSFVLENLVDKRSFQVSDAGHVFSLMGFAGGWKEVGDVERFAEGGLGMKAEEAKELVSEMMGSGMLVGRDRYPEDLVSACDKWGSYGWDEPFLYHLSSKDYPFQERSEGYGQVDSSTMEEYASESGVPDVYKDYLGARQIALPTPRTGGGPVLSAVLVEPLGTGKPADVGLVSDLLYCSFGKTGTVRLPVLGDSLLKAVPSGGARHPTEAYLYNFSIKGLPKGLFHYSVRGHSLEVLREGDFDSEVMETVFELRDSVKFACRAVVFVTSRFERNMWRYREPRTFRTIFFDMGHAVQNLVFAARAAGRRSYVGYGYDVERLERLIGIDGLREGVFYFAAIG